MTVRRKVLLVAMAIAALGISALAFDAWRWRVDAVDDAERETRNLVTVFADHTSRTVQPVIEALDILEANVDGLLGPNRDAVEQRLRSRLGHLPQLLWFTVVTAEGRPVATLKPIPTERLGDWSKIPWFAKHRGEDALVGNRFGPLMKGDISGDWFVPITRAIYDADGGLKAVIATAINVRYFVALYGTIDIGANSNITLMDSDGRIVARYPEHDAFVGRSVRDRPLFTQLLPNADSGHIRVVTAGAKRPVIGSYRRVPDYPLVIAVLYGADDIFAAWRRSLPLYGLGALLLLAFVAAAALAFIRAAENAKALAVAQKEVELALSSERELAKAREGLADAQRIGNMGNWEWNIETNELSWSDQIYRIFGLSPREFGASYPAFLERVHPEDVAAVEAAVARALAGAPYALDHRIVRADGSVRVVHEEGEVVRDSGGKPLRMVGVVHDVTDLREAERTLIAAKEEAELSSRAKSEFLANMSHELRTPLNAIIGFSEIMHGERFGPMANARYKAYADDIRASGEHLLSVINDILDVSKIEAGRMELRETAVDLRRVIAASLALVQGRAEERRIALETARLGDVPPVKADERKIKQIVINLLSNAVKFTPKGGKVSVSVGVEDGWACIRIRDTGIGIPADRLEQLARPFVQIESGLNRRFEGTGLGLALSKALAELHQGALTIDSEVGSGTVVTLRLPPERVAAAAAMTSKPERRRGRA